MNARPDVIWRFDSNHREYGEDRNGPIWRKHWQPKKVFGETRVSWLCGYEHRPLKVPKKNPDKSLYAFSEAEIDEQEWVHNNGYRISNGVHRCNDPVILRQIAALINYKEAK